MSSRKETYFDGTQVIVSENGRVTHCHYPGDSFWSKLPGRARIIGYVRAGEEKELVVNLLREMDTPNPEVGLSPVIPYNRVWRVSDRVIREVIEAETTEELLQGEEIVDNSILPSPET